MFAKRHRNGPEQFIAIRGKADTIANVEQEQRIGLGVFAPGDVAHGDIDADQIAAIVAHGIIAAEPIALFVRSSPGCANNLDIDQRLTAFHYPLVVRLDDSREFRHSLMDRLAEIKIAWVTVHLGQRIVD